MTISEMTRSEALASKLCAALAIFVASGCAMPTEMDEGDVEAKTLEIHRGLDVHDSSNDDPEAIEAVVMLSNFRRWDGAGSNPEDTWPINTGYCSGIILASDAIVTAGHCLSRDADDGVTRVWGLKAGETARVWVDVQFRIRSSGRVDHMYGWYQASLHHHFDRGSDMERNDITVLVSEERTRWRAFDPAEIWAAPVYTGMRLDMYGWGPNSSTGSGGGWLRKGHDNSELRVDAFNSHMLRGSSTDARTCKGDSGGPLIRWVGKEEPVIGILSNSTVNGDDRCTKKDNNRQSYTRLAEKRGWIEQKIGRACNRVHSDFYSCQRP